MSAPARLVLERPRDLGTLLQDSIRLYRAHAGVFAVLAAAVVVPVELIVSGVGLGALWSDYRPDPTPAETAVPAVVSQLVTTPLVTAMCIHTVRSAAAGRRPDARAALHAGFDVFPVLLLAVLLASAGIFVGFLALVLPGLYLLVVWYFVAQGVVVEGARGAAALRVSSGLVRGSFWRVLGIVLVLNLLALVPAAILSLPFAALASAVDAEAFALAGGIAGQVLVLPIVAIGATLLFFDLRARRRGGAAAEEGTAPPSAPETAARPSTAPGWAPPGWAPPRERR